MWPGFARSLSQLSAAVGAQAFPERSHLKATLPELPAGLGFFSRGFRDLLCRLGLVPRPNLDRRV